MSAKSKRIYLVRHGEAAASWGQSADPGLSELGREQARQAARELQGWVGANATLISSPLQRAQQTAEPLASALGLDFRLDSRFREIPSPVPLEGRQAWLRSFMAGQWSDQGEELIAWRSGIQAALTELPEDAVVFTHFLVLNTIVGAVQDRDETLVFWPANASITELEWTPAGYRLVQLGEQMASHIN